MFKRTLGKSGIEVSALGLGCWPIGGRFLDEEGDPVGWGSFEEADAIRALQRALELGVTFFDTADVYGTGTSEEIIGKAFAGRRDEAVIATKFGKTFDPVARRMLATDTSPEYIREALEASLRRLGTDYVDLYQLHLWDLSLEDAVSVRETLEQLAQGGKIRGYGWSTGEPERARIFAEGAHCIAVQHPLNVIDASCATMLDLSEQYDLASIVMQPLAMGLLSGKYSRETEFADDDVRRFAWKFSTWFDGDRPSEDFLDRLAAVREILSSGGRTLAQGALAWIWARSERTVPIPGFKSIAQVEQNAAAMDFGPLAPEQMQEIERLFDRS
jgi:aryl-alcohol dehydrogenase-like predicted oxidoreductase